jgi:hypothetical protein
VATSPSLRRLQARHWALVALAAAAASATGRLGAGGILLGGGLIGLSVFLYSVGLRAVLGRAGPRLAIALLFAKLLAFLGLGWWAFASGREHRPDPIGFAVGLTCFPVAAVWEAMRVRGS